MAQEFIVVFNTEKRMKYSAISDVDLQFLFYLCRNDPFDISLHIGIISSNFTKTQASIIASNIHPYQLNQQDVITLFFTLF